MSVESSVFQGQWQIYEMAGWDEDYFNMMVQAYIEIKPDNLGYFQFGLVEGQIDGKVVTYSDQIRFEFTWDGYDENEPMNGSGWIKVVKTNAIEGEFRLHLGDDSTFKARKA